ncbi:MAG: M56 family metallopeptidase, partial [Bacteroidota bacterium]|nr:M56 family metallopeptidase [Bacteroidota bacterium]
MDLSAFQNSLFLQALGGALLNSVWQACILWILFETISLFFKRASSRFRFNMSFLFLMLGFFWFLKDLLQFDHPGNASYQRAAFSSSGSHGTQMAFTSWHTLLGYLKPGLPFLSFAYMLLLFLLSIKLVASYFHVYQVARRGLIPPPSNLEVFMHQVSRQMKLVRTAKLWISQLIDVPATIGFFKPVILIPVASLNHLSTDQLEAIIIHELAHIKRYDYLVNILITIIETILFFNPFIALLIRTSRKERENC